MNRRRMSLDRVVTLVHQAKRRKGDTQSLGNDALYSRYTVAWICALHIEMAAARAMLDEQHDDLPNRINDTNSYILGTMQNHNVVIACLPADQYGTNNAASVLSNMKSTFPQIRIGLMVGIGGGVPTKADIRLGDVVVGIRVMQSDLGKTVNGRLQRTAVPKIPDSSIRTVISNLRSQHELNSSRVPSILEDKMSHYPAYSFPNEPDRLFQPSYNHELSMPTCDKCDRSKLMSRKLRSSTDPVIHYGAIASGNQVMKDAASRDEISRELDVICFEMEAAGLMDIMPCLPIRGICDYSDSHKSKEWQRYAAATAAAYAYELLGVWGGSAQSVEADRSLCQDDTCTSTERREKLMESMNFEEIDSRKTTIKAAYSKTCQWILKHPDYITWTDPQAISQHHGFLWIRGKPGAGKSTIMKFLYSRSKSKDRKSQILTSSFFFNARGVDLEKTVSGMYRSLLLQLFKGFPDLQSVLDDPDLIPQSQTGCPSLNVLKDLLQSAVSKLDQRSFTCYVDALDECDEQQVMDLVEYFEELAEQCTEDGVRLQICFSSRHYPYIDMRLGLRLILEEQVGHVDDLETYIKTHLRVRDPSLLAELQSGMLAKAAGVFLWVVLVVDILNRENRRGRLFLRTRLEEVPSGLSELFKDLLRRDNSNMEEFKLSILWILLSNRPLKPGEYYHGLWSGLSLEGLADLDPPETTTVDADDCFDRCVISSSKGLAEITKSKQPVVQFIHESVRDFLIKERGLHELWPELGADWESVGHESLKICCNCYLKLAMTKEDSKVLSIESKAPESVERKYPLLEYASQFVLHHADRAANAVCQSDFLQTFPTRDWIVIANCFEKFKRRRYTTDATLIYVLAERGYPLLIRETLKTSTDIESPIKGERYKYPLIAAMAKANKDSVAALLDLPSTVHEGVDITEGGLVRNIDAGVTGHTPLTWAFSHGYLGIAKVLLQRGAHKKETYRPMWTPLMYASMHGRADMVQLLIDEGADVNITHDGETAVSLASARGHAQVVKMLLDARARLEYCSTEEEWLIRLAAGKGHKEVLTALLNRGLSVNKAASNGMSPLHFVARWRGSEPTIRALIKHGANVHPRDIYGETCLMYAVKKATLTDIECLIDHGADVMACDQKGNTCLHFAVRRQKYEISELLIQKGADVRARNHRDETCLHMLGLNEKVSPSTLKRFLQLLNHHEIDLNARDIRGNTTLHRICRRGLSSLTCFLSQPGFEFDAQNHDGQTPLHFATLSRASEAVRILKECGADINIRDNNGNTPLDLAMDRNFDEIRQFLVNNGGIRGTE